MKAFLRELKILSGLSDEAIELLARTAAERHFRMNDRIVRKDEIGDAAFILREGVAEALIEKPGAEPLRLSQIMPGDMFGELALFDDSPRSATVVATTDCRVIEIRRDAFLQEIARHPETALQLLSLVAKRLRRAETIVSDFSDRIYGDVLPRLQEAVLTQLSTAKTICEEAEKRAQATIAQARHLQDTTDQHWTVLTRVGTVVGIFLLTVATIGGWLGYNRIEDTVSLKFSDEWGTFEEQFRATFDEVERLQFETERTVSRAKESLADANNRLADIKDLESMRETVLEFDKMRRDLQLGANVTQTGLASGDKARDFVAARRSLMEQYFKKPAQWESDILIEALDLLTGALDRHYMIVDVADWEHVIDTIIATLKTPISHWRQRLKLNELVAKLYVHMSDSQYQKGVRNLIARMEALLESGSLPAKARSQTATILAKFGSNIEPVQEELRKLLDSESAWRRSQAAIALVTLGEDEAWNTLRRDLAGQFGTKPAGESDSTRRAREVTAFAAAHLIVESATLQDVVAQRYFGVEALDNQLSKDRFGGYLNPWPGEAPVGADLVGYTVVAGLTTDPGAWNRLYWQYSCDLICDLGCQTPGAMNGGKWCTQCMDTLDEHYFRGPSRADRTSEKCESQ